MTATTKPILKGYFNDGDRPDETQFANLIDSFMPTFRPEDYGAVANGVTEDTAAIQAAIDAASAAGGGIVRLTGDYAYDVGGETWMGLYGPIKYGVYINHDNVFIEGPGVLRLASFPSITPGSDNFAAILFCRLGRLDTHPGLGGTWIQNVGTKGIVFDNSALTIDQIVSMCNGTGQIGNILFSHAKHFYCNKNMIIRGFGHGCIYTLLASSYGQINNNTIIASGYHATWLDGLRESEFAGNRILGDYGIYSGLEWQLTHSGIVVSANGDNTTSAMNLHIHHNTVINAQTAIQVMADNAMIDHNYCVNYDARSGNAILNTGFNNGKWTCSYSRFEDNTIYNDHTIGSSSPGLYIYGDTANSCEQVGIIVKGNRINIAGHDPTIKLGEQVKNCWVVDNFIDGDTVVEDPTCSGNVITPNY